MEPITRALCPVIVWLSISFLAGFGHCRKLAGLVYICLAGVACTGLALLAPSVAAGLILVVAIAALVIQARSEDEFLARRFPDAHGQWRTRSGLLLPRLSPSRGIE